MRFPGLHLLLLLSAALLAGGCATAPDGVAASPWARQSGATGPGAAPWAHKRLPGKPPTEFRYQRQDGREAIAVRADASASLLRQEVRLEPQALGRLRFSWKVPALIPGADLAVGARADAPVRIVLAFEGDRSRFAARDAALSELVRALTGEDLPYATLMYVWSNGKLVESVVPNARTGRIRKLVVESGPARLGQWLEYERDVAADFLRAFGEPPGALVGIAIMTDSDNTGEQARAWYGPLHLLAPAP